MIIAIDGPAAAGKGTLARRLAAHYGLPHLDTGLLYRAVGRRVLDVGGNPADAQVAEPAALGLRLDDLARGDLRGPAADEAASKVAAHPAVRAALLDFQRQFAVRGGAVLDGRDIGTVIFPDAAAKLFVTASVRARSRRRWNELTMRGVAALLEDVTTEIRQRDAMDSSRAAAPLLAAADAVTIDTSSLSPDEAFEQAVRAIEARLAVGPGASAPGRPA